MQMRVQFTEKIINTKLQIVRDAEKEPNVRGASTDGRNAFGIHTDRIIHMAEYTYGH